MAVQRHTHKYIKRELGTKEKPSHVYACALPNCTHFMPKNMEGLLIGKTSICWECEAEFPITINQIRKAIKKPRCMSCRKRLKEDDAKPMDKAIDDLINLKL